MVAVMTNDSRERAIALMHTLGVNGTTFPVHALKRLSALVNDEDVVYAEAEVEQDADRQVTGAAVVFTATRVIRADVSGSPVGQEPADGVSTVTVRAWGRRSLAALDMLEGSDSTDWAWHHEWDGVWPHGTRARLTYNDGTELTLPLGSGARAASQMSKLLPGLLEDLSKP